jgi:hypothetical protein
MHMTCSNELLNQYIIASIRINAREFLFGDDNRNRMIHLAAMHMSPEVCGMHIANPVSPIIHYVSYIRYHISDNIHHKSHITYEYGTSLTGF